MNGKINTLYVISQKEKICIPVSSLFFYKDMSWLQNFSILSWYFPIIKMTQGKEVIYFYFDSWDSNIWNCYMRSIIFKKMYSKT